MLTCQIRSCLFVCFCVLSKCFSFVSDMLLGALFSHVRLLTTLEVWTRPPRMQLATYRETTIHQGGDLHLECQAHGVPAPLLSWVLPDRSVLTSTANSSSRITMYANGTLHIPVTQVGDRGMYRCVASNSAGAASASVRVHVSSLPPVIQQPRVEHLLLTEGRPVYAHCSARGAPPPTLRWHLPDGTVVRPSQFLHGNLFVLPNGTLHIRKVGPKDSGAYECILSNSIGADKRTVRVEVKGEAEGERRDGTRRGPSSSLKPDAGYPLNPVDSSKQPPPSPSDRSSLPLTPSTSHPSSYVQQPNSADSPPKINQTDTSSRSPFISVNTTNLSSPQISSSKETTVSRGFVNNTKNTAPSSFQKGGDSAVSRSLPISPFSKARIVSTSPSITTISHGGNLQLHCSVTGNPSPIIIWRTPSRKLVDMHFR